MGKTTFSVAFLGKSLCEISKLFAGFSPYLLPRAFESWEDFAARSTDFSPELVVVFPDLSSYPPYPLAVPIFCLEQHELSKSPEEIEALILAAPGRPKPLAPQYNLLGCSSAIAKLRGSLVAMSRNSLPLLLTGENGTGKDLAANVAHELSARAGQPFVPVNCGAVPAGLAETEFFGCVRGAFTGAENRRGFCQQASGGTLFLDEVGELPPEIQAKLLRVLENKEIRKVGTGEIEKADFRLICATNRDLPSEVKAGRFREDLFYRINVLPLRIPALRERLEDLPILTAHFLASDAWESTGPITVGKRALAKMAEYHWPGNLRQLRNVVLRAAVLHGGPELQPHHIEWDY